MNCLNTPEKNFKLSIFAAGINCHIKSTSMQFKPKLYSLSKKSIGIN